jgi:hypothetical protein
MNAGRFGKFRRNALQRAFGDAGDIDLDVEYAGDANLAQDLRGTTLRLSVRA